MARAARWFSWSCPELRARGARRAGGVGALLGLAALGCESDKVFTPFQVLTQNEAPARQVVAVEGPEDAGSTSNQRLELSAPEGTTRWTPAGRGLDAPQGLVFSKAVLGVSQSGDPNDVVAWLSGTADRPVIGELWYYPANGAPSLLMAAPGFLPTGPTCLHTVALSASGAHSLALDIVAVCSAPLLPRSPVRSLSVVVPGREPAALLSARVALDAPGEQLHWQLGSEDRDGDGRDDVQLLAMLRAGDELAEATLAWVDRSVGVSRDTAWPARSFQELAGELAAQAKNPATAARVPARVGVARRLYGSLCAEAAVPRLFDAQGEDVRCGPMGKPLQAIAEAHVEAERRLGGVEAAIGALEQARWFPSAGGSPKFFDEQFKRLLAKVPLRKQGRVHALDAEPVLLKGQHASPLRFDAEGNLLVLTQDEVVRVSPNGEDEDDAPDVAPWSVEPTTPQGERFAGVAFPCDSSEVLWLRSNADGVPLPPLASGIVAARPGPCRVGGGWVAPRLSLLGFGADGPEGTLGLLRLGGSPAGGNPGEASAGKARRPRRRALPVPGWGLVVTAPESAQIWNFVEPGLLGHLEGCVVEPKGQVAACLAGGRVHHLAVETEGGR